jgi:hypothetical protein
MKVLYIGMEQVISVTIQKTTVQLLCAVKNWNPKHNNTIRSPFVMLHDTTTLFSFFVFAEAGLASYRRQVRMGLISGTIYVFAFNTSY